MRNHKYVRVFVNENLGNQKNITLNREKAHYLVSVMRYKTGDRLYIFDGESGEYEAEIFNASKNDCSLNILSKVREFHCSPDVMLCYAPVKNVKSEYIIQKATELGVAVVQPMITQNTIKTGANTERYKLIAEEAAEQCERLDVPQINEIIELKNLLPQLAEYNILFCDESGQGVPISSLRANAKQSILASDTQSPMDCFVADASRNDETIPPLPHTGEGWGEGKNSTLTTQKWAILIGPEGGFSKTEIEQIYKLKNVFGVGLGPRILRADTAIITALALWQNYFGDFNISPEFRG
ncbi:MAG TPA: 16S rRNA (uracil(1498)-N(3))-methyltransferase [Alphaproteobacteria bacterium]|nr:16S rRNA (uracil(1498)-N(3))-methyltransferase [Alphaproteobacteria bacterium]